MKAQQAYQLKLTKGGRGPAFMSGPQRTDRIEVVDLQSGEVVFHWDLAPRAATRVVRTLREDLRSMEAEEFVAAWRRA